MIIAAVLVVSCQQEDIFDIPYSLGAEENQMLTTLLPMLKAEYNHQYFDYSTERPSCFWGGCRDYV
ncbi:MAG: hypothetical protein CM15mP59_0380 [Flavobacteriaceae bacterium]|nr:MAG: hypothetical protein CM15mP59_0380 [Flavobacteriaceae bacterium]